MSESNDTTETFKKLLSSGLISASDLVAEGFHDAASAVMVGTDGKRAEEAEGDNAAPPAAGRGGAGRSTCIGVARERTDDGGDDGDANGDGEAAVPPTKRMATADPTAAPVEPSLPLPAKPSATAADNGFSNLSDELRMMFADREAAMQQRDDEGYAVDDEDDDEEGEYIGGRLVPKSLM